MENTQKSSTILPPRILSTFVAGFNKVAGNIYLIILPVLLDIFLWLGPRLSLQKLLQPFFSDMLSQMTSFGTLDQTTIDSYKQMFDLFSERYNLFTGLHSLPVGVPGLFNLFVDTKTPLGNPIIWSVSNSGTAVSLLLLFILLGIFMGSFYFYLLNRATADPKPQINLSDVFWQSIQVLLLTIIFFGFLLVLGFPISMVIGFLSILFPGLTEIILIIVILIALWVLMPLIFSAHGIFTSMKPVFKSIMTSIRLVRFFLPGTGLFVILAVFASQLMGLLWVTPAPDSWLMLIGIFGNAFVSTSLLAASFIYYRGGLAWMDENLKHLQPPSQVKA